MAHGVLRLTLEQGRDLPAADYDGKSDPFVVVELGAADANGGFEARETFRSTTKSKTLHPSWYEVFTLVVADPATDRVRLKVFDYDLGGDPDPLGVAVIAGKLLKDLSGGATRSFWMRLDKPPTGSSFIRKSLYLALSAGSPARPNWQIKFGTTRKKRASS